MKKKKFSPVSLVVSPVVGWFLCVTAVVAAQPFASAQERPFSQDRRVDLQVFTGKDCYPDNLVAADLNADGRTDLAVTGFCQRFAVFFADPAQEAGRFLPPKEVRLSDSVIGMAVLPRKTKGPPFLVVSNCSNPDTQTRPPILQIVSMETLKVIKTLPSGGKAPDDIAVADFNKDGLPDLLVGHWKEGTLSLLLGQKDEGSFQAQAAPSPLRVSIGDEHWQVEARDFNHDGRMDAAFIVWTFGRGNVKEAAVAVLLGNRKGELDPSSLTTYPVDREARSLAVADLDRDGALDIAVPNPGSGRTEDGSLLLLFGKGNGEFLPKTLTAEAIGGGLLAPQGIVAADFDGDGRPDLATASRPVTQEGRLYVLRNAGQGRFSLSSGQTLSLGLKGKVSNLSFQPLIAADLNGDGAVDLAVTNQEANTVSVFFNTPHP